MSQDYARIKEVFSKNSVAVIKDLENQIKSLFDKCGLYYKCFGRLKSANSISEKIEKRFDKGEMSYKLQDLIGIRIVVYFKKDIPLCEKIIKNNFKIDNISKDEEEDQVFKPQRINYVCRMPDEIAENFDKEIWEFPIDRTFEIQVRTIFSEGWHEVEHDFRYKCADEWEGNLDLSRTLNGIWATLDNCDWSIESLLHQLAHRHYKNRQWIPMLKNVFRMRIIDEQGMDKIEDCFEMDPLVAKRFLRLDREDFLIKLSDAKSRFPMKLSTLVFLANYIEIKNSDILKETPKLIIEKCKDEFGEI